MARAFFTNTTPVKLGGKLPGQKFQLEIAEGGAPVEPYWRKRLNAGEIAPASTSPASDEAPKKLATKKGA